MAVRRMVQVGPVPSPGWWCRASCSATGLGSRRQ